MAKATKDPKDTARAEAKREFFEWVVKHEEKYPELRLLAYIGSFAPAAKMGVRPDYPCYVLPVHNDDAAALLLYVQAPKERLNDEQRAYIHALANMGNQVSVAHNAAEAIQAVCDYLGTEV